LLEKKPSFSKTCQSIVSKLTAQFGERDPSSLAPEEILSFLTNINQWVNAVTMKNSNPRIACQDVPLPKGFGMKN
jgi:hypothetical protein